MENMNLLREQCHGENLFLSLLSMIIRCAIRLLKLILTYNNIRITIYKQTTNHNTMVLKTVV